MMRTMKDKLKIAFLAYIQKVKIIIGNKKAHFENRKAKDKSSLVYINPNRWLRNRIEELEESPEFKELVSVCSGIFGEKIIGLDLDPEEMQDSFFYYMRNFFYRSGCYLRICEEDSLDMDDYFDQLWNAYTNSEDATFTFLSLLTVRFPENLIDFGTFKIQRFTKEELDDLCQNQINRVFYPEAIWNSESLSHFWFIKEEESKLKIDKQFVSDSVLRLMKKPVPVRSEFPDQKIRQLLLFDWNSSKDQNREWEGFSIPIVLRIDNDILWPTGQESPKINKIIPFWVVEKDSKTGKDVKYPSGLIKLEKNDLEELKKLVKDAQKFSDIRPKQWEFIDNAMKFLAKAFFTEGLEQLLWHIVVLEALFVKNGENKKEAIKKRICIVLGENEEDKIGKLYNLRSELVHGELNPAQVYTGDLWEARDLARRSVEWFLDHLLKIHKKLASRCIKAKRYPQRKMILNSLDCIKEGQKQLDSLIEIWQKQQKKGVL
jgi:hypothetical protein